MNVLRAINALNLSDIHIRNGPFNAKLCNEMLVYRCMKTEQAVFTNRIINLISVITITLDVV